MPVRFVATRMLVETPVVVFALLLPFVATGPRTEVLGASVSEPGLTAAVTLLLKATLGVAAALLLAATTQPHDVVRGLERLRLPAPLVQIMAFMVRYLEVVGADLCADEGGPGVPWLPGARPAALAGPRDRAGRSVHPLLRARGAGAPGDDLPRPRCRGSSRPSLMSTPVLDVRGLAHAYPDGHQALYGVDLHVHQGERVALLGPNGAGKTTLVLHLNGVLRAGAGTVAVSGLPVEDGTLREVRRRVGIVFQDPDDQLFMPTVGQDVAFGPRNLGLRGAELEHRVAEALELVGMGEHADRPPHHLSFGQRRRVAVATVLAMRPEILVLDEPSSNLDPASRRELAEILRSLDVTVLMVTHDLPYAWELCERSVVLSGGVVVADGGTAEVLSDAELLAEHRLELPAGFRPEAAPRAPASGPAGGL